MPSYVLDQLHRIVSVEPDAHPVMLSSVGEGIYSAFPGSQAGLEPIFRMAWDDGLGVGCMFYQGSINHVVARRDHDLLEVCYQTVPLTGLREALEAADVWLREGQSLAA